MNSSELTAIQFVEAHLELEAKGIAIDWKSTAIKLAQAVTKVEEEEEGEE